ncbi:TasA family protein [Candidatus Soleaferrea massiliensis]|uniref:TasA family protein n=1 Tax=Candidatus Soleaferrea massiliensis TaxID=1470354 RepID=UPI0018CF0367|nr:TasA family protein [Candidatus Soleaferrea massiliensis]
MKKTRRELWTCGLVLLVCMAMLIATTLAWFSDTVSNKGNRIQAGTLNVLFSASNAVGDDGDLAEGTTGILDLSADDAKLFDESNWQPGDTLTRYLRVKNTGSLALKYDVNLLLRGNGKLDDAIEVSVAPLTGSPGVSLGDATGTVSTVAANVENIKMNGALTAGTPEAKPYQIFQVDVKFLESAGNTYNAQEAGAYEFGLDVVLTATQNKDEATVIPVRKASDFTDAAGSPTYVLMDNISGDVKLSKYANIDLNGYTLDGNLTVSIPASEGIGTMDIGTAKNPGKITGTLRVDVLNGTVNAYDAYDENGQIIIDAVSSHSFHFYGNSAATIELKAGRLVIEDGAVVGKVLIPEETTAQTIVVNNGTIDYLDSKTQGESTVITGNRPGQIEEGANVDLSSFAWDGSTTTPVTPEGNVYTVSTPEELAWIAAEVNGGNKMSGKTVRLSADVNMGSKNWTPIGNKTNKFFGTFDGAGHTVSNLLIDDTSLEGAGLIGFASSPALIKGVTVHNAKITAQASAGSVVGSYFTANIEDCHATGLIQITTNYKAAGLAGEGYGTVKNCSVDGDEGSFVKGVYLKANLEGDNVGGLIAFTGELNGKDVIVNCHADIKVEGTRKVGGLIGYLHYGCNVVNSYALGDVSIDAPDSYLSSFLNKNAIMIGGLVGEFDGRTVESKIINCYATGKVTGSTNAAVNQSRIGGLAGGSSRTSNPLITITDSYYANDVGSNYTTNSYGTPATKAEIMAMING